MSDIAEIHMRCGGMTYDERINPGDKDKAKDAKEWAIVILDKVAGSTPTGTSATRRTRQPRTDADNGTAMTTEGCEQAG